MNLRRTISRGVLDVLYLKSAISPSVFEEHVHFTRFLWHIEAHKRKFTRCFWHVAVDKCSFTRCFLYMLDLGGSILRGILAETCCFTSVFKHPAAQISILPGVCWHWAAQMSTLPGVSSHFAVHQTWGVEFAKRVIGIGQLSYFFCEFHRVFLGIWALIC